MNPRELKQALESGEISKQAYIEGMFEQHKQLFQYTDLIEGTNVESIQIGQGEVRVRFAWPPIELVAPRGEMRAAPVEAVNFGSYEQHEFVVVEKLVRSLPGESPLLVDIGGNVGFYSIGLKKLHPNLRIHAFEPIPATADQFERNAVINDCHDLILHRHGLSDAPGEARFFVHRHMSVAASQQNILEGEEMEEVVCPLLRLDDLREALGGPVGFIKCDVEGAELFAFKGAASIIEQDQPVVFSEMLRKWSAKFDYHPNDIIGFFRDRGYRCHALSIEGATPIDSVTDSTVETNFVFLHSVKHEGLRLHS
ncbi:MAG: FkbM family methyltransferase [Puniceicoccaceae bacterium]